MQIKKARVSVTHTRATVKKRFYFTAAVDSRVINFASTGTFAAVRREPVSSTKTGLKEGQSTSTYRRSST